MLRRTEGAQRRPRSGAVAVSIALPSLFIAVPTDLWSDSIEDWSVLQDFRRLRSLVRDSVEFCWVGRSTSIAEGFDGSAGSSAIAIWSVGEGFNESIRARMEAMASSVEAATF